MILAPTKASLLPGIAACALAVAAALVVNRFVPGLSPATAAVALGSALASAGAIRTRLRPGLLFVSRRVLRAAIVLLGLQIAVPQILALGWQSLAVVAAATGLTFVLTPLAGRRLGLPPGTSLLVATGVSICGASAIAAMHDSTDSSDDDAAGALAVVVLYGSAAIVVLPLLASWLGLSPEQLGVWAGAAVHEVAQVAAIGAASGTLVTAVTVKLGRVVLLAPIVAITTSLRRRAAPPAGAPAARTSAGAPDAGRMPVVVPAGTTAPASARGTALSPTVAPPAAAPTAAGSRNRTAIMPLFVAGFLAMVVVRSTGLLPPAVTENVPVVTNVLMAAALFALGTGIDLRKLLKGGRVMLLGGIATGLIGAISLAGVSLLS
ncbi:putative sulfate exporter family transporter [Nonomuraea sp. B19D2]|uniref:YeiH family protein n=1 Tax=Nonomuraea sp. B19D2 TaxID=3159561 RepID=UPI0032DBC5AD